jgi:hypothetical protein
LHPGTAGTDCTISAFSWSFAVEAFYLKLVKLYVETIDKLFKDIVALVHKLCRLFISQNFLYVLFRLLKVREKQYKDFFGVPRDFNKVNLIFYLMKVTIQHLSCWLDSIEAKSNVHWRGSFLCHYIQT